MNTIAVALLTVSQRFKNSPTWAFPLPCILWGLDFCRETGEHMTIISVSRTQDVPAFSIYDYEGKGPPSFAVVKRV